MINNKYNDNNDNETYIAQISSDQHLKNRKICQYQNYKNYLSPIRSKAV